MDIRYSKIALKTLQRYDRKTRERLRSKIYGLTKEPPEGDIKPVKGRESIFRLRVGKYRVLFEYLSDEVIKEDCRINSNIALLIIDVDTRGDIYQ